MNSMLDYIKTNIDPIQALNMAYTIYKFPNLEIKQLQIPIPELTDGRLFKNLGWVFLMDTEQNTKYLKEFVFENKYQIHQLMIINHLTKQCLNTKKKKMNTMKDII